MQANNDPNWTEDAAFWNEAWADMDKRLDQEPPSGRKAAAIWWRQYSWLLGLFLAGMVAIPTIIAYWPSTENTEQLTPAPTDVAPPSVIAAKTDAPATVAHPQLPVTADNKAELKTALRADQPSLDKTVAVEALAETRMESEVSTTPVSPVGTGAGAPQRAMDTGPVATEALSTDLAEKPTGPISADPIPREEYPPAPLLPVYPVSPLNYAEKYPDVPADISMIKSRTPSALYLTGGATQGLRGNRTGYYAGLQYQFPAGKRFSIPVDLRFRKDYHSFKGLSASDQPSGFLDISDVTSTGAPDTIFFVFSEANITSVTTTSLEATIGLNYSPAPRWQVGVGLSLNYLNTARARVSTRFLESANFAMAEAADIATNIALFNNANSLFSRASMDSQNAQAISVSSLPEFNQWIYYGNLSVSYALTPKISLAISGRSLLSQPDRSRKIGMQQGQLEVGAKWRIR